MISLIALIDRLRRLGLLARHATAPTAAVDDRRRTSRTHHPVPPQARRRRSLPPVRRRLRADGDLRQGGLRSRRLGRRPARAALHARRGSVLGDRRHAARGLGTARRRRAASSSSASPSARIGLRRAGRAAFFGALEAHRRVAGRAAALHLPRARLRRRDRDRPRARRPPPRRRARAGHARGAALVLPAAARARWTRSAWSSPSAPRSPTRATSSSPTASSGDVDAVPARAP